ncbi:hypothetical protein [Parvicella tangerina]|uniref:Uncharacterized protein n=1 Tax=Parvicella tangerina TaxID=2829795 RepID=A0A916JN91_9FLAO|nr:hypothetical protein [Parvicella tangerina]CAG5083492.1 hypothetical protein CRYO30217_02213 [Parvicella tangerina]
MAKVKLRHIGERITHKEHDDCYTIVISPTIERWQMNSLLVWVIAWTFCGMAFAYYTLFESKSIDQLMVFSVILVFWLYFEIRVVRAFMWRKYGLEVIRIDNEYLSIKDSIFKHGKPKNYEMAKISPEDIEDVYINPKSYGKVMNDSFWQVGQGTIALKFEDKNYFFGTQLENKDSAKLARLIRKVVEQYKSKELIADAESN